MRSFVKLAVATAALSVLMTTAASAAQIRYDLSALMSGTYSGGADGTGSFTNVLGRISAYGDTTQLGQALGIGQNAPTFSTVNLTYAAVSIGPLSGAIQGNYFGGDSQVLARSNVLFGPNQDIRRFALTEVSGGVLQEGGFFQGNATALRNWDGVSNLTSTTVTLLGGQGPGVDIALQDGTLIDQTFAAQTGTFSATILDGSTANAAILPNAPSASGYGFVFDAQSGQPIFIDPLVATGYDYTLASGSPLISQALFPTIAGSSYQIFALNDLLNPLALAFINTPGGVSVDFSGLAGGGINGFRLTGINVNAGVDPFNANAFVTGLTFASNGPVSITQTPLSIEVGVPEPASWALMILGFGGVGAVLRGRRREQPLVA